MEKMMNFIMISPHFPANFEPFSRKLNEKGIRVLGIADESYDDLSEELKQALTEYYRVDNMLDYEQVYRAVAYFAYKYGKIDRIESHNEFWLETDARLRTDFNISGLKDHEIGYIKRKSKMKEIFLKNGFPAARGRVFGDFEDAEKLIEELGFPVIIKPDSGVGGADTWKIKNSADLEAFYEQKQADAHYIMEEFVDGSILSFDGLTDKEGNIVFSSSLIYEKPVLDILETDADMFFYIPRELPADVVEMGTKCVKAFDIKERFFHFEFFRRYEDSSIIPLELNCRPPGGASIDMFNYANDLDIFEEYANIVAFDEFRAVQTRPYNCCYVSRKGHKPYKYTHEDIMREYGEHIMSADHIPGVFAAVLGDFGYIVRTPSIEKQDEIIKYIAE